MYKQEIINAFVSPATQIWERELGFPLTMTGADAVSFKSTTEDITAAIQVAGQVEGTILYGFSIKTARTIVATMLGEEHRGLDEVARSALSELANMITVNAASELGTAGYTCKFGQPTLLVPTGTPVQNIGDSQLRLSFSSDVGFLHIRIALSDKTAGDDSLGWLWQQWR